MLKFINHFKFQMHHEIRISNQGQKLQKYFIIRFHRVKVYSNKSKNCLLTFVLFH